MFRRRTDQVYSTLQQVQRRITEQSGNPPEHAAPVPLVTVPSPQPLVNLQPLSQALPSGGVQAAPVATPPPFAGAPAAARLGGAGKRYVLQLSGELATLLVVMWLISMALMFVLGQHWRSSGGAGIAAGPAGNREIASPAVPKRQGNHVYVLQSQANATVEVIRAFEKDAKRLNDYVRANPNRGWKPYFGVRTPPNGGVELAFGLVDGVWGIDKEAFTSFAKLLAEPTSKGGGGFTNTRWAVDP